MEQIKNTIEEKARFFAQYYGQRVLKSKFLELFEILINNGVNWYHESFYLKLKPLSEISDEQAIEVAKIMENASLIDFESNSALRDLKMRIAKEYVTDRFYCQREFNMGSRVADYLRRNGFLIEWNGLSTETLIAWGWVKID